jgi:hypothetical protein
MSTILMRQLSLVAACCLPFAAAFSAEPLPTSGFNDALGPNLVPQMEAVPEPAFRHPRPTQTDLRSWVLHWNEVAVNASGLDHTPVAAGETRVFGEQLGPARASRAMAIVHIAMFESMNAIDGGFKSYVRLPRVNNDVSMRAAIAVSAHDTLVAMFPSQTPGFDRELADSMSRLREDAPRVQRGVALGKRAATAILALRSADGSQHAEPRVGIDHITSDLAGHWRQDPISHAALALGAHWAEVRPFVLRSAKQFRVPPPPAMTTAEYAEAFEEVTRLGGDGVTTPTERTEDQTFAGIYWAYDGTPSLCAPPRLYNQIATTIALQRNANAIQLGRLLAVLNVAMADSGIAIWESKYFYDFWRPITGVREADEGSGPTGSGDGNPATHGDPTFMPLGAPGSNLQGPNFTPPFPSYPSGHAGFGGALFQTLRDFYRTDRIAFTFVSDEFNGVTRDNQGNIRPLRPRTFQTLSAAEEENGQSRIYLGIHWAFDKTEGLTQGEQVADYVFARLFAPIR